MDVTLTNAETVVTIEGDAPDEDGSCSTGLSV